MRTPHALRIAQLHWAQDKDPPLDIIADLMELGFHIPTLEAEYRVYK